VRNSRRIALTLAACAAWVWIGGSLWRGLGPRQAVDAAPAEEPASALRAAGDAEPAASEARRRGSRAQGESADGVVSRGPLVASGWAADHAEGPGWAGPHAGARNVWLRAPAPRLDAPHAEDGAVTTTLSGSDPAPPRLLTLWRVEGGRSARLALTSSGADGRFRFPEVATAGSELVVLADDEMPASGARSVRLPVLDVGAPSVEDVTTAGDGRLLRIWASSAATSVVVASQGREIARRALPMLPGLRARVVDVALAGPWHAATLWVAEERADGARSPWRCLESPAPAPLRASTAMSLGEE
jgi:hypothetical protein